MNNSAPRKRLPVYPSLEHLQKQAKRLAKQNPSLKLAEAQHQLAREYGCKSWAELSHVVETMRRGGDQLSNVKREVEPLPKAARLADRKTVESILQSGAFTQHDLDQGLAHAVWYEEHGTWEDRKALADLLLSHGADPDGQYGSNYGPIVFGTCECLNPEGLQYLIDAGADVKFPPIQTKYGRVCPLANVLGTYNRGRNERKHRMIDILLRNDAYLPPEFIPPILAIHRGDAVKLAELIDQEPGLIRQKFPQMLYGNIDLKGATLLHCAVEFGELECLQLLFDKYHADINMKADIIDGIGGQTPIYHAINTNADANFPILEYLVKRVGPWIDMSVRATWRDNGDGIQPNPITPLEYAELAAQKDSKKWRKKIEEELSILRSLDHTEQLKAAIVKKDEKEVIRLLDERPDLLTPVLWPPAIFQAKSLSLTRLLLDRGLNPDECTAPRKPLHLAVYQCLPDIVELLIERGADVNLRNPLNETPLELLDAYEPRPIGDPNSARIRQALRKAGAKDDFLTCIRAGEIEPVRKMLQQNPELARSDSDLGGPLFVAARSGRVEVVATLLEYGADPNKVNSKGNTPLWFAAQSPAKPASDRIEVMKVLLESGADIHRQCENQTTALHFAAWRGPAEVVEFLLSRGARNWTTDDKGRTPLDHAVQMSVAQDREKIIQLLSEVRILDPHFRAAVSAIDSGDVNELKNILQKHPHLVHQRAEEEGWFAGPYFRHPTLLHFIANNPYRKKTMPPNILESAEAILDAGADIDALTETENPHTVLGLVTSCEPARKAGVQVPLIELLVRRGANPSLGLDAAIIHGETEAIACLRRLDARHTLMSAAALNENTILRNLLRQGPSERDQSGAAAAAAMYGKTASIEALLETGLAINARITGHPYGPTLLHQAAWFGHRDLADWLIEHGADLTIRDLQHNGTPADWAEHGGQPELASHLLQLIKKKEIEDPERIIAIDHFVSNAVSGNGEKGRQALKADPSLGKAGFWTALVTGDLESIRGFLKKDPSIVAKAGGPKSKWQPLHYLSFSQLQMDSDESKTRFTECARLLLQAGADVNASWEHESWPDCPLRPLYGATGENNNPELARLLLENGAMINDGESIYHAAQHYHLESMEVLRKFGVSLGLHPHWKNTPAYFLLSFAPTHIEWPVIKKGLEWLLEHGCDPNIRCSENQESALHAAIRMGHEMETMESLIQAGADVNQARKDGKTPLALAQANGMKEIAALLLEKGARLSDLTPADYFFAAIHEGDIAGIEKWKKDISGFPDSLAEEERLSLNRAAEKGNLRVIRLLLETGFDIAYKGTRDWGATPLHLAAWNGQYEAVKLLLERGAPVDVPANKPENSPALVWAAHGSAFCRNPKGNYPALVEAMIAAGAIPDESQAVMASPETAACIRKHMRLAKGGSAK